MNQTSQAELVVNTALQNAFLEMTASGLPTDDLLDALDLWDAVPAFARWEHGTDGRF